MKALSQDKHSSIAGRLAASTETRPAETLTRCNCPEFALKSTPRPMLTSST